MATRLSQLCTLLVENAFGELAAQIFSVLADHGRQTLPALHVLTRMPLRRLKTGLGILIQHHILHHDYMYKSPVPKKEGDEDSGDDSDSDTAPICYQVNWTTAYGIVRTQRVLKLVADREGIAASKLLSNVLQLGHASIEDLVAEYDLSPASKRDSGVDTGEPLTNGGPVKGLAHDAPTKSSHDNITSLYDFYVLMRSLVTKGYLVKVSTRSYLPEADRVDKIKQEVIAESFPDGKITGPKKSKDFQAAFNTMKRKYEEEDAYRASRDDASRGTIKKAATSNNKRVKLNGHVPNGFHNDCESAAMEVELAVPRLPDDMIVRVNFEKCTVLLRSYKLEQMAKRHLGPVTASVYGATLQLLEHEDKYKPANLHVEDEYDSDDEDSTRHLPSASDSQVLDAMPGAVDLGATTKFHDPHTRVPETSGNGKKRKHVADDDEDLETDIKCEDDNDEDDGVADLNPDMTRIKARNRRLAQIEHHLEMLAEHPQNFVSRSADKQESRLQMRDLTNTLINDEIDAMVAARFGKHGLRAVRLLREKGKLDERQIAAMGLIPIKQTRGLLTQLQFAGLMDIQELPKDGTRQPSRTVYLWSFDQERVEAWALQQTYATMTRLLERCRAEREGRFRSVIEKAERVGGDGKGLGVKEREVLKEWREVEETLLVQVARCDEVVAVLRDFRGDVEGAMS